MMQMFQNVLRELPYWGLVAIAFFFAGLINILLDIWKRPRAISSNYLYQKPISNISIFGIIGLLSWGLALLSSAYGQWLEPEYASNGKALLLVKLGGLYGPATACGLLGLFLLSISMTRAYELIQRRYFTEAKKDNNDSKKH